MTRLPEDFVVFGFRRGADRWVVVARDRRADRLKRKLDAWVAGEVAGGGRGRFLVGIVARSASAADLSAEASSLPFPEDL